MIRVTRRRNARNVTARRHPDGTVSVSIPALMPEADARRIIDRLLAQLPPVDTNSWQPRFRPGQTIDCGEHSIVISTQTDSPQRITALRHGRTWHVGIGSSLQPGERDVDLAVNKIILRIAHLIAPDELLPEAQAIAARLGVSPSRWEISRGHRTLGTCHHDRHIALSSILVFLPPELRNYVVCHELAHLSEMNHSARFHKICNSYCGGRETALRSGLRHFAWPIIR